MKRSFVFVPVILIGLFLLDSFFVPQGNEAGNKAREKGQLFTGIKLGEKTSIDPLEKVPVAKLNKNKFGHESIILKSTDGGQTWQDISHGLPEKLQKEGVRSDGFFANDSGIYISSGSGIYHSELNSTTPNWTREIIPGRQRAIAPGKNGILAYNFIGQFLRKVNGTSNWSQVYQNLQEKEVCSVFETTGGAVLIGSNNAVFRSTNRGKTWKKVPVVGWVMKMVESNGVLLIASTRGISRSTNDGESWDRVINEGGEGITVERINGGFAAIAYNSVTQRNRIHISLDNGKTWDVIGEARQPFWNLSLIGRQPSFHISSIKQVGEYIICGRSDGIFRSADMGKTWELLLPSTTNSGFSLTVSGKVIYAIPNRGC